MLVVPFSSVAVRSQEISKVSKEPEVQGLRHQWHDHVLLRAVFLVVGRTRGFVILIFIFMHVQSLSQVCWFSLGHSKDYMFLWVTRPIARFSRRLICQTRQVQHHLSHC